MLKKERAVETKADYRLSTGYLNCLETKCLRSQDFADFAGMDLPTGQPFGFWTF